MSSTLFIWRLMTSTIPFRSFSFPTTWDASRSQCADRPALAMRGTPVESRPSSALLLVVALLLLTLAVKLVRGLLLSKDSSRFVAVVFHQVMESISHRVVAHWSPFTVWPPCCDSPLRGGWCLTASAALEELPQILKAPAPSTPRAPRAEVLDLQLAMAIALHPALVLLLGRLDRSCRR